MPLPTFLESPRFPDNISYGSSGGPTFRTEVFTATSGAEQRNMLWSESRAKYNIALGIRDKEDMDQVLAFFYNVRGKAIGFRFKDWADYLLINELIGTGNSVQVTFPLIKTYTVGVLTYIRPIRKPVADTFSVSVAGSPLPSSGYTVDTANGTITFAVAPLGAIRVDCEFDTPVRFDTDEMPATHEAFLTQSWSSIPLIELLASV